MGKDQLAALARIIDDQLALGQDGSVLGTWTIRYDAARSVLYFEKCEDGFYCEERPAVISLTGEVIDKGGPILMDLAEDPR